jgi:hypothetical protein
MEMSINNAGLAIKAIVVLHNFLIDESGLSMSSHPSRLADHGNSTENNGIWRRMVPPMESASETIRVRGANNYSATADTIRENLINYFSNEGYLDWQDNYV